MRHLTAPRSPWEKRNPTRTGKWAVLPLESQKCLQTWLLQLSPGYYTACFGKRGSPVLRLSVGRDGAPPCGLPLSRMGVRHEWSSSSQCGGPWERKRGSFDEALVRPAVTPPRRGVSRPVEYGAECRALCDFCQRGSHLVENLIAKVDRGRCGVSPPRSRASIDPRTLPCDPRRTPYGRRPHSPNTRGSGWPFRVK